MAKSLRSKKEKRLRAIRREMVDPIYEKKEAAKQTALELALAAPKLPVRVPGANSMDAAASTPDVAIDGAANVVLKDVEMEDASQKKAALKPMGKRMKKKLKIAKKKGHHGKGKLRRKHV